MKTENIKIKPKWTKSKDEIWAENFAGLEDDEKKKIPLYKRPVFLYAGVAAVLLAIIIPSIAFLYTKDITVPRGQHYTLNLPDGSRTIINAESKLTYKPFWWRISRDVKLEGEAYFDVQKGSEFEVRSGSEIVMVLGTSFNILSRTGQYNVACLSGKVKVKAGNQSVILTKGMQTVFENNTLQSVENEDIEQKISWTKNKFVFNEEPLVNVIREIERQYNIEIVAPENINYIYSGNFTKLDNPEDVLQIIQEPFGIKLKIKK
ncbi:DUF4974 domain-containing protein [Parabacteroides sp. 52]|uniref:FecR family protein n=1 Tax=unclassified Parabacteroides TaxID=2649774 RepID=UPI0013D4A345|nr:MULTISPECIES: FecR domain-containing protein [unclassified Parabacteroides]MDH6535718.1 transmembrane sensor [Parabacteroides sp. PM5-20]NDV56335.1 DUF4974 domain-containing protein [Parabacteroides sp. 52]